MERRFYTLDVFTTTRFEGNPLAVITDGDGLSNDAMLAVAREMNLSETVFVQKPTEVGSCWRSWAWCPRRKAACTFCSKLARECFPSKSVSRMAARSASP